MKDYVSLLTEKEKVNTINTKRSDKDEEKVYIIDSDLTANF